jgi:hypothetical protein
LHAQALKTLFLTNLDNLESKKPEKANFASLAFSRKSSKKPKSQKPKARGVPALDKTFEMHYYQYDKWTFWIMTFFCSTLARGRLRQAL